MDISKKEKNDEWKLTKEGKIYRKGVKKYANKDVYEVIKD